MIKRKIQILTNPVLKSKRTFWFSMLLTMLSQAAWGLHLSSIALERGFAKIKVVSEFDLSSYSIPQDRREAEIKSFCDSLTKQFRRYSWHQAPCEGVRWEAQLKTNLQHPIIFATFGKGSNTTLILGGVHPDELTPIHLAFRFARYLEMNPSVYEGKDIKVVIAPVVNPDGFLKDAPTRTNASEIDLNRNFLTLDWYKEALYSWAKGKNSRRRFFPGFFPNSEIETVFQAQLLETYKPSKILSIHAPLGFYDYDGPGDKITKPLSSSEEQAKLLIRQVSEKSKNYRIVDYSFYPGSLGNLAGKQRRVPTLTLELETTNPKFVDAHWKKFLPGILQSVQFPYHWKPHLL